MYHPKTLLQPYSTGAASGRQGPGGQAIEATMDFANPPRPFSPAARGGHGAIVRVRVIGVGVRNARATARG